MDTFYCETCSETFHGTKSNHQKAYHQQTAEIMFKGKQLTVNRVDKVTFYFLFHFIFFFIQYI